MIGAINGLFDFSRSINPAFLIPTQSLPQRVQTVIKTTLPFLNANETTRSLVSYLLLAAHVQDLATESMALFSGKKGWEETKAEMLQTAHAVCLLGLSIQYPYLYLMSSEIYVLLNNLLNPPEGNLFSHFAKVSLQSLYLFTLLGESPTWKAGIQAAMHVSTTEEGKSGLENEEQLREGASTLFFTQLVLDLIGRIPLLFRNFPDIKTNRIIGILVVLGRFYQMKKRPDFLLNHLQAADLSTQLTLFRNMIPHLIQWSKESVWEEASACMSSMHGVMGLAAAAFELFMLFRAEHENRNYRTGDLDKPVKMEEVIGCEEAKKALTNVIDQIKNRDNYTRLGPLQTVKGILFYGPPGTGKTVLAKAFATEVGASKFISQQGSAFVDRYVGTGARSMRALFDRATALAKLDPNQMVVVFIDEINGIAGKRDIGADSGTQEFNRTTEAFLVEIDKMPSNIIVIGGTNTSPLELDPAFVRSGRFDKHIEFKLPTLDERKKMIAQHTAKYKVDAAMAGKFASRTEKWNYADLENWMKQAQADAGLKRHETIREESLDEAYESIRKQKSGSTGPLSYYI